MYEVTIKDEGVLIKECVVRGGETEAFVYVTCQKEKEAFFCKQNCTKSKCLKCN